jgi:hypothetical protein
MKPYSLCPLSALHPFRQYKRRLTLGNQPLSVVVNGDEIGLQREFGDITLIATHYDYFDGVNHWFYLLSDHGRVLDQVRMPDVFGFIQNVTDVTQSELAFGYFGSNDEWRISISRSGSWSFKLDALLKRPNRFLLARRHLTLHRKKGPPWRFQSQRESNEMPAKP